MTRPPPLSAEEQRKRMPLPVEVLACALVDRIHPTSGRLIRAVPLVRPT